MTAAVLTARLPAAGRFRLFLEQSDHANQFQFGREPDGTPAAAWDWDKLDLSLSVIGRTSLLFRARSSCTAAAVECSSLTG